VVPLVLVVTSSVDFFMDRNLIAAWVPLAAAFGGALALSEWRPLAVAALGAVAIAGVGVTVEVADTRALQRSDWRDAVNSLGPPIVPRAVIVNPSYAAIALRFYGHRLVNMPIDARVEELDIIGEGLNVNRPAPPGVQLISRRQVQAITLLRYRPAQPLRMTRQVIALAGQQLRMSRRHKRGAKRSGASRPITPHADCSPPPPPLPLASFPRRSRSPRVPSCYPGSVALRHWRQELPAPPIPEIGRRSAPL
jgi:hypothetical protein